MTDDALLRHARQRYGNQPPSVYRMISDLRCGYQQGARILERMREAETASVLPTGDSEQKEDPGPVLDVCCGSRMFWFDPQDSRAVFLDKRNEIHVLVDKSSSGGSRELVINPDIIADFTNLPFPDNQFFVVVFDPPHLGRNGSSGWMAKKYGTLSDDWEVEIAKGFAECFRVLKPNGTLIFKWNENEIPVSKILSLTPTRPLFGNRCGKQQQSHWIVFIKPLLDAHGKS